MITVSLLIEALQKFHNPEDYVVYSLITLGSLEDITEMTYTEDEWLSIGDEISDQLDEAIDRLEIWNTLTTKEEEKH